MGTHIHIAIPCYGGMISASTARSTILLTHELSRHGIGWSFDTVLHESLVQRARNIHVSNFLKNGIATHLFFIDADIEFRPEDVLGMLATNHRVVCSAYPKKVFEPGRLATAVKNQDRDPLRYATTFAINPISMVGEAVTVNRGCVPVLDAATGFLMMKRAVLESMCKHYTETLYYSDASRNYGEPQWALFDCAIEAGRYLSEDYLFSRRWQKMGGTVWLYLAGELGHFGNFVYRGDLNTVFAPVKSEHRASEWGDIPTLPDSDQQKGWHLYRYAWAAQRIKGTVIANAACGTNYGAVILRAGHPERSVKGYDRSDEALAIAASYAVPGKIATEFSPDIQADNFNGYDTLVCLETIEHLRDPASFLKCLAPNELVLSCPIIPTKHANEFHLHDFTEDDVYGMVRAAGYRVVEAAKQDEWQKDAVILIHAVKDHKND